MLGLCRRYNAMPADKRAEALRKPSMRALVSNAGGMHRVDTYCNVLLTFPPNSPKENRGKNGAAPGKDGKGKPTSKEHPDDNGEDDNGAGKPPKGNGQGGNGNQNVPTSAAPGTTEPGDSAEDDRAVNDGTAQAQTTPPSPSSSPTQEPTPDPAGS
jgi:hypothetical protein